MLKVDGEFFRFAEKKYGQGFPFHINYYKAMICSRIHRG